MKPKVLISLLIILLARPVTAQLAWEMEEINVDSLQEILASLDGTERIDALNMLSLALCRVDPDSSISIAQNTIDLSEQANYQKGKGDGYFNLGIAFAFSDSLKLSIINYLNALRIYEAFEPSNELAETLLQLSLLNWIAGRYETARKYCEKAKGIYKRVSNFKGEAWAGYTLSHLCIFEESSQYDSAIYYLDLTLEILDQHPDQRILYMVYQNYGNSYSNKWWGSRDSSDYLDKAMEWYFKAYDIMMSRYDSSESTSISLSSILGNIGYIYIDTREEENIIKGYDYLMQAKNVLESVDPDQCMLILIYTYMATAEKERGKHNEAIGLYLKAIAIADRGLENFSLRKYEAPFYNYTAHFLLRYNKYKAHNRLYNLYSQTGDFQHALEQYQLKEEMRHEISQGKNQKLIAALEAESENEKTEKTIALLARDNEMKDMKVRQSRVLNMGIGIIFIILILVGILFLRQNKLRNEHKSTMLEQKLLRLQMNPHFIFNALSNILSFVEEKDNSSAINYLSKFSKLLRNILESSRDDHIVLEQEIEGLRNYLELQKLRYEDKFEYEIDVDEQIDTEDVSIPPLLIQPFIENAIEHGIRHKETIGHIYVRFLLKDTKIHCEVEDDGVGREKAWATEFHKEKTHKSLATIIITERIRAINKRMKQKIRLNIVDLKSVQNEALGTKVVIDLPLMG
jgi:tetratricopeptide (TPR) repeat protein